jgi:hypothetical protein
MDEKKLLKISKRKSRDSYVAHISIIDGASRDLEKNGFIPGDTVTVYRHKGLLLVVPEKHREEMAPVLREINHVLWRMLPGASNLVRFSALEDTYDEEITSENAFRIPAVSAKPENYVQEARGMGPSQPAFSCCSEAGLESIPERVMTLIAGEDLGSVALKKAELRYADDLDTYHAQIDIIKKSRIPDMAALAKILRKIYMIRFKTFNLGVRRKADDLLVVANHFLTSVNHGGKNVGTSLETHR